MEARARQAAEDEAAPESWSDPDEVLDLTEVWAAPDWDDFGAEEIKHEALDPEVVKLIVGNRMMTVQQLFNLPKPTWFISGLLPAAARTIIHGHGGSKKSFIVLDWMLSASTGRDWQGHRVREGKGLYIAGEGVYGLGKRVDAWAGAHEIDPASLHNIDFMPVPINFWRLGNTGGEKKVEQWRAAIAELEYDYIVVDTLHTAMSGGEENSAKDIGQVYDVATRIAGRASLIFVHHDPKMPGKSARGSSSITDSVDVSIAVDGKSDELHTKLSPDKVRDARPFRPFPVHFTEVQTPRFGDGETSLYVSSIGTDSDVKPAEIAAATDHLPSTERKVLEYMRTADGSLGVWKSRNILLAEAKLGRTAGLQAINSLIQAGHIIEGSQGLSLSEDE